MEVYNEALEIQVLSGMIEDEKKLDYALIELNADDFFDTKNILLFNEIKSRILSGKKFIINEIYSNTKFTKDYIIQIINPDNWVYEDKFRHICNILKDYTVLRNQRNSIMSVQDNIKNGINIKNVIEENEKIILKSLENREDKKEDSLDQQIAKTLKIVEDCKKGKTGLKTGYQSVDDLIIGMNPGDYIVIAARPSIGKSAFAANIMRNVSKEGVRVLFFSLEMMSQNILARMLASECDISYREMRKGLLNQEDINRIVEKCGNLTKLNMIIKDKGRPNIEEIFMKSMIEKKKNNIGLIIIDHLLLIPKPKGHSTTDEVGYISGMIKHMAKTLEVPVIALQQLNRANQDRKDKRPELTDLRASGDVEQDADTVIMLHRDDYYDWNSPKKGVMEILVKKGRETGDGFTEIMFVRDKMKFYEIPKHGDVI